MKKLDNVNIGVQVHYEGWEPDQNFHVHSYTIEIVNNSSIRFQLMRRKWEISNGLEYNKVVEGDGVIGEQPILEPGGSFHYSSWCPMPTSVGYMKGIYFGIDVDTNEEWMVEVPLMTFVAMEMQN